MTGECMWLSRREILEQLVRLGIKDMRSLKNAYRNFETYWKDIVLRTNLAN